MRTTGYAINSLKHARQFVKSWEGKRSAHRTAPPARGLQTPMRTLLFLVRHMMH